MSLVLLLDRRTNDDPAGIAVADASDPITNAALLDRVRGATRHLKDLGVRPGDVVAVELANRVELVVLLFAIWRLGAAIAPVEPNLTDADLDRLLNNAGACLLVAADGVTNRIAIPTLTVGNLNQRLCWPDLPIPPHPDATALLVSTRSDPHGAMFAIGQLEALARGMRNTHPPDSTNRREQSTPLALVERLIDTVIAPLLAGASVVVARLDYSGGLIGSPVGS